MIDLTKITEFLEDDNQIELSLPFIPLIKLADLFGDIGFNTKHENGSLDLYSFDTNGWQVDFSWDLTRNDKEYLFTGSLFYGEFKLIKI